MIIAKEHAIKFMMSKASKIKEFCNIDYFTKLDISAIDEMDDDKFVIAWQEVVDNILRKRVSELASTTCVFCMYYTFPKCQICGYSKNHDICGDITSDWSKIIDAWLLEKENLFTNEFYVDLLKQIGCEIDN